MDFTTRRGKLIIKKNSLILGLRKRKTGGGGSKEEICEKVLGTLK